MRLAMLLLMGVASCATPQPETKVFVVQEVAYTLAEPLPIATTPTSFIPSNAMQVICTSSEAAQAIEHAAQPIYDEYANKPGIDQADLTALVGDTVNNHVGDRFESGECSFR